VKITSPDAADAPALKSGPWSLMQEMGVREAAQQLRQEYSVRRQILLRRLDCSVQAVSSSERASTPSGQRKVADVLSRMWSGWRRSISEAPPLSEWSALAVSRGIMARAVESRVAGPGSRTSSSVKSVLIGSVPDRGGIPDGYMKDAGKKENQASAPPPSAPPTKKARTGSSITTVSSGTKSDSSTPAAASSSDKAEGKEEGKGDAAAASGSSDSAAAGSEKREKKEEEPVTVGEKKPEKKGTAEGARSANKELMEAAKAEQKKEREEGKKSTYYEELADYRG